MDKTLIINYISELSYKPDYSCKMIVKHLPSILRLYGCKISYFKYSIDKTCRYSLYNGVFRLNINTHFYTLSLTKIYDSGNQYTYMVDSIYQLILEVLNNDLKTKIEQFV